MYLGPIVNEDLCSPSQRPTSSSVPVEELIDRIQNVEVEGMDDRDRLSESSDEEDIKLGKKKPVKKLGAQPKGKNDLTNIKY